jgi:hypothetical protein
MRASTPIILKKIKVEEQKPFCRRLSKEIYYHLPMLKNIQEEVYKPFYRDLLPTDAKEHKRVFL